MKLGRPSTCGVSGNVMDRQPFAPMRWISSTASSGSHIGMIPRGMNRSGYVAHHSSSIQSL